MERLRNARWITTLGVENILHVLGVDPPRCTTLNWTEDVKVGSVTIMALPARHFSGRSLFNRLLCNFPIGPLATHQERRILRG
jgi:L-ascorbate metabolism protein UlaG (beta-lactamase superfamily)